MSEEYDITGDLDLLGDWLDAKGYTEEAGLCTRAMDEINKLRDGVRSTIQERDVLSGENWELRAENEKLRAALIDTLSSLVASVDLLERGGKKAAPSDKMFAQMLVDYKNSIERGRAAAAALKETTKGQDES